MGFSEYFPISGKLSDAERKKLESSAVLKKISKGSVISGVSGECTGLILVKSGRLRAYINSDQGREVTLYHLLERDFCLFSASCIMKSVQFDVFISAVADSEIWVIPAEVYKEMMSRSAVLANYTAEIMGMRFTDVMWLVEQILWKSFDRRLASFLCDEAEAESTDRLKMTHEQIAANLGSAREVVTRMLKYFQEEGLVSVYRGMIEITDKKRLASLAES